MRSILILISCCYSGSIAAGVLLEHWSDQDLAFALAKRSSKRYYTPAKYQNVLRKRSTEKDSAASALIARSPPSSPAKKRGRKRAASKTSPPEINFEPPPQSSSQPQLQIQHPFSGQLIPVLSRSAPPKSSAAGQSSQTDNTNRRKSARIEQRQQQQPPTPSSSSSSLPGLSPQALPPARNRVQGSISTQHQRQQSPSLSLPSPRYLPPLSLPALSLPPLMIPPPLFLPHPSRSPGSLPQTLPPANPRTYRTSGGPLSGERQRRSPSPPPHHRLAPLPLPAPPSIPSSAHNTGQRVVSIQQAPQEMGNPAIAEVLVNGPGHMEAHHLAGHERTVYVPDQNMGRWETRANPATVIGVVQGHGSPKAAERSPQHHAMKMTAQGDMVSGMITPPVGGRGYYAITTSQGTSREWVDGGDTRNFDAGSHFPGGTTVFASTSRSSLGDFPGRITLNGVSFPMPVHPPVDGSTIPSVPSRSAAQPAAHAMANREHSPPGSTAQFIDNNALVPPGRVTQAEHGSEATSRNRAYRIVGSGAIVGPGGVVQSRASTGDIPPSTAIQSGNVQSGSGPIRIPPSIVFQTKAANEPSRKRPKPG